MDRVRLVGVDLQGPSAVRDADLNERLIKLGYDVTDEGNIVVRNPEMVQITDRKLKLTSDYHPVSGFLNLQNYGMEERSHHNETPVSSRALYDSSLPPRLLARMTQ